MGSLGGGSSSGLSQSKLQQEMANSSAQAAHDLAELEVICHFPLLHDARARGPWVNGERKWERWGTCFLSNGRNWAVDTFSLLNSRFFL